MISHFKLYEMSEIQLKYNCVCVYMCVCMFVFNSAWDTLVETLSNYIKLAFDHRPKLAEPRGAPMWAERERVDEF